LGQRKSSLFKTGDLLRGRIDMKFTMTGQEKGGIFCVQVTT